jgi:cell division protein FtsB
MDGVMQTAKAFLLPAAIGAMILYFSYHALAGDQGLAAWNGLQEEEEHLEAELARLESERAVLETSLDRLRDRTLDLDYVEEIARTRLSYVRPDEVLVAVR